MKSKVVNSDDLPRHVFSTGDTARLVAAGIATGVEEEAAKFTLDDVFEMMRIGALDPDAKVELIDGRVIEMAPEGVPHVRAKMQLAESLIHRAGSSVRVIVDSTLRLSATSAPDPDLYLYPSALPLDAVDGASVGLIIEVAQASLAKDLMAKAGLYARHGVRDYWVVDVAAQKIIVHRDPKEGAYGSVFTATADELVTPLAFPHLPVRLSDLPAIR
ncbi:MAG: Uma2 family endonuclease [Caulobacter sp.]|nr:Uma2 family endonuclease [Caulobacter sp.]